MYLTYIEYLSCGGTLDEPTFNRLEFRCRKMLDKLTAMRISKMKDVPEAVKHCMLELISQESVYDKNSFSLSSATSNGQIVSSFSTDGYQESYGGASMSAGAFLNQLRRETDALQRRTINDLLAYERDENGVKLLYRGVF